MKKIIFGLIVMLSSFSTMADDMRLPFRGVTDGDTIRSSVKLVCPLCNVTVRLNGIDTPESSYLAKCPKEKALGLEAKAFLQALFAGKTEFMARNVKWDKYGGRILAYVELDGKDVGQLLIDKGLAKPYTGSGPKPDWCN